jgi:3-oxoadipate CoA-transferase alpha subunit
MIDKRVDSLEDAVAGIGDGAVVLISGFGEAGNPTELVHALIDSGARDLTVVNNNAGNGHIGLAALLEAGRVRKVICSYPRSSHSEVFQTLFTDGAVELETIPQGTLAERMRAAGAGIGGFYTPTTVGTPLAEGKESRVIDGREYVLEMPLRADFALVKAEAGDRWGNLTYRLAARNFGPVMCMAADVTIVQVRRIVELGDIDPEVVVTPGIFVDRVVEVPNPMSERAAIERGETYP